MTWQFGGVVKIVHFDRIMYTLYIGLPPVPVYSLCRRLDVRDETMSISVQVQCVFTVGAIFRELVERADRAFHHDAVLLARKQVTAKLASNLWGTERKNAPPGRSREHLYSSLAAEQNQRRLDLECGNAALASRQANIKMKDALFQLLRWLHSESMGSVARRIGPIAMNREETRFSAEQWCLLIRRLDEYAETLDAIPLEGSGYPGKGPDVRWLDELGDDWRIHTDLPMLIIEEGDEIDDESPDEIEPSAEQTEATNMMIPESSTEVHRQPNVPQPQTQPDNSRNSQSLATKKKGGRPSLAESTNPKDQAKVYAHRLVREAMKSHPEWKEYEFYNHFKRQPQFESIVKSADCTFNRKFIHNSLQWAKRNPIT